MSSGLGMTQPALLPASDQEMQREKTSDNCPLPPGRIELRESTEEGWVHPSPPLSAVGWEARQEVPTRDRRLWGVKWIQSTHPVL